jgi:cystathionine beta-lyase/cystathionine gamma-synthase
MYESIYKYWPKVSMEQTMKDATFVNHPPLIEVPADNRPLVAPIYQSVKFTMSEVAEVERLLHGDRDGYWYSRQSNPTLRQLEQTLATLQHRESCVLTASGVAAVNLSLLSLCKQGDHVICFAEMYQPTRHMIRKVLHRYGVTYTLLSIDDIEALESTLSSMPTRLVMFESPTNPILKIADIARITELAARHGALTVMDNTLAGFHNHGQYPVDVFVHSLTKYASGHGDVMGGAVIANKTLLDPMRRELGVLGATLDPHAAYLIQRGMKTYSLRYAKQCANALEAARFLLAQPRVSNVRYPGLEPHPQHALAKQQMHDFGTVIAFDLSADKPQIDRFANTLRYFAVSASLGATESQILTPSLLHSRDLSAEQQQWSGVTGNTLRLSMGIEDSTDLIGDLEQALAASI